MYIYANIIQELASAFAYQPTTERKIDQLLLLRKPGKGWEMLNWMLQMMINVIAKVIMKLINRLTIDYRSSYPLEN